MTQKITQKIVNAECVVDDVWVESACNFAHIHDPSIFSRLQFRKRIQQRAFNWSGVNLLHRKRVRWLIVSLIWKLFRRSRAVDLHCEKWAMALTAEFVAAAPTNETEATVYTSDSDICLFLVFSDISFSFSSSSFWAFFSLRWVFARTYAGTDWNREISKSPMTSPLKGKKVCLNFTLSYGHHYYYFFIIIIVHGWSWRYGFGR